MRGKKIRMWWIHDGDPMISSDMHNFVNRRGIPTLKESCIWWQEMGLFTSKRSAEKWAEVNNIPSGLWVHSITIYDWMLEGIKEEGAIIC